MESKQLLMLATALIISISSADAESNLLRGSKGAKLRGETFNDRMEKYTDWARYTSNRGRRLSDANSPLPQPATPVAGPVTASPPGGSGGCKVLKYYTGFANTTLYYDVVIKDTPNFGECCHHCQADDKCQAWTRVAGGDPANFRNCYLKYSLKALDQNPDRLLHNHEGHPGDTQTYPELRYVDNNYPSASVPLILESGTTPDYYPADYYGCPYAPGNPTTPCVPPPNCNVDGNGVFVAPPCIQ